MSQVSTGPCQESEWGGGGSFASYLAFDKTRKSGASYSSTILLSLRPKQIKGPDNPTCQLLPISSQRMVKLGWERQEREKKWWKSGVGQEWV